LHLTSEADLGYHFVGGKESFESIAVVVHQQIINISAYTLAFIYRYNFIITLWVSFAPVELTRVIMRRFSIEAKYHCSFDFSSKMF
jgi:hypothetical protein